MTRRDGAELFLLGALWGASFLFMRIGAPEFGPLALVWVRVAIAAALLLPLVAWRGELAALRTHWKPIAVLGIVNSALPFLGFMVAALVLSTGLMSIFNATVPLWGALIGALWLHDRPGPARLAGLALGLGGVIALSWGKADFRPGEHGVSAAIGIAGCLMATLLYALAAHGSKRHFGGVPPLAVAAGSQVSAAVVLLVPALATWPEAAPSAAAWGSALTLAVACTALAYILYFRIIAHAGATAAMSVTYLIPAFAMFWGFVAMGEVPTPTMLAGAAAILLGTALTSGLIGRSRGA